MTRTLLVTRRELTEVVRDFNLVGPIFILPTLMALIVSLGLYGTSTVDTGTVSIVVGSVGVERMPPAWSNAFLQLSEADQAKTVGKALKALTLPLFWIVTVALTATVAADSFVGEKERDTLEPLLATPIGNGALFFGKLMTAVVPAVLGTWWGTAILAVGIWFSGNQYFPHLLLADPEWTASTFIIVPLMALMSASVAALISTRVATYRAAYQLNGLIVLPIVAFMIPQTVVLFFLTRHALWVLGTAFVALDVFLIATAIRFFDRERLLGGR
ncbi:MAG TPA: ABC transporter permease [Chloroflexota bacterium]|nr:ABC transporter permease [Chloroflexota bacterium]